MRKGFRREKLREKRNNYKKEGAREIHLAKRHELCLSAKKSSDFLSVLTGDQFHEVI